MCGVAAGQCTCCQGNGCIATYVGDSSSRDGCAYDYYQCYACVGWDSGSCSYTYSSVSEASEAFSTVSFSSCADEAIACSNSTACTSSANAWSADTLLKMEGMVNNALEFLEGVGAAIDESADDSGCCDDGLCAALCALTTLP